MFDVSWRITKLGMVYCIDLKCCDIDDDGVVNTAQTLNKFKESELQFADIQTERKQKLKVLKNVKKEGL